VLFGLITLTLALSQGERVSGKIGERAAGVAELFVDGT
jgi:hypothetical protein